MQLQLYFYKPIGKNICFFYIVLLRQKYGNYRARATEGDISYCYYKYNVYDGSFR